MFPPIRMTSAVTPTDACDPAVPLRLPADVLEGITREHVHYEVDRLVWWSHVQIPVGWFNVTSSYDPNVAEYVQMQVAQATLEVALIHLRNVAEFLTGTCSLKESDRR